MPEFIREEMQGPFYGGAQTRAHSMSVLRFEFKEITMTITIQVPKKFRVTLENYDGRCKRMTVLAHSASDAMAMCHKGGWQPVDVLALV